MKSLSYHPVAKWIIALILITGVYFFHIFFVPALAAMIITFVTWTAYIDLLKICRGKSLLASSIATIFIVLLIIVPFLWLAHYVYTEIRFLADYIVKLNQGGVLTPEWMVNLPLIGRDIDDFWVNNLQERYGLQNMLSEAGLAKVLNYTATITRSVTRHFGALGFSLLFAIIILFFLYKDGRKIGQQIDIVGERVFPDRWHRISRIVPVLISSTVIGMVVIAIGEGIVFGIVYYFVGAPAPITLGIITGVFALIPGGAPMSMTVVSLYLLGSGKPVGGSVLFFWGAIQLFVVDKTIRPRLVGGPAKLPFLPTILGLVGGVKTMGMIGLFIGPVVMALLVALWREWVHEDDHILLPRKTEAKEDSIIETGNRLEGIKDDL